MVDVAAIRRRVEHEVYAEYTLGVRWHEAGHFVACCAVGDTAPLYINAGIKGGVVRYLCDDAQDIATIAVAGAMAAGIAGRSDVTAKMSDGDRELFALAPDPAAAIDRAAAILERDWQKVEHLARALAHEPFMDGDRAVAVMGTKTIHLFIQPV